MVKEHIIVEIILLFFLLFYISKVFLNSKPQVLILEENSLCRSMLGYTNYIIQNNLCKLPCYIKNKYIITNKTYGQCRTNNISIYRNKNYIYLNEDGYIIYYNFNNREKFAEKVIKIYVKHFIWYYLYRDIKA